LSQLLEKGSWVSWLRCSSC